MKHIKTFENWFTNIFKSDGSDTEQWDEHLIRNIINISGYNGGSLLRQAVSDGNLNKFKRQFPKFINKLNDITIDPDDNETSTILTLVASSSECDISDKKKMIKMLIDNGADPYFFNDSDRSFYDMIREPKLNKWVKDTYPEIVDKIELKKNSDKYNL